MLSDEIDFVFSFS